MSVSSFLQKFRDYVIENAGFFVIMICVFGIMYANMYGYIDNRSTLYACLYLVYMSHDLLNDKMRELKRNNELLNMEVQTTSRRTNFLLRHTLANMDDQTEADERFSKLRREVRTLQSDMDDIKYYCMSNQETEEDDDNHDEESESENETTLLDDIKELLVDDNDESESQPEPASKSELKTLLSKPAVFHLSESTGNVTISVVSEEHDD